MCRRVVSIGIVLLLAFIVLVIIGTLLGPVTEKAATQTAQALAALPTLASLPTSTPIDHSVETQISLAETRAIDVNNQLSTTIAHATQVELTLQAIPVATTVLVATMSTHIVQAQSAAASPTSTNAPSVTVAPTSTLTPSATITNTMTPSLTPTLAPTVTPEVVLQPLSGTYYAQGSVNVRNCPRKDCTLIGSFTSGQSFSVSGWVNGDEVKTGNVVWYQTRLAGHDGYVYSEFVTDQLPPTAAPPPAAPMVFQGTQGQVLGPLTFTPGLFKARVTTTGFFIAELKVTQGDCEAQMFTLLFNLMEGQANGAEATITSTGCTTFIEISNVSAAWRLEISPIG